MLWRRLYGSPSVGIGDDQRAGRSAASAGRVENDLGAASTSAPTNSGTQCRSGKSTSRVRSPRGADPTGSQVEPSGCVVRDALDATWPTRFSQYRRQISN